MLLEDDDDDEIQIIPRTNEADEDTDDLEPPPHYPPMPDWLTSANGPTSNHTSAADTPPATFDLDDLDFEPARITLGRVAVLPEPTSIKETTTKPQAKPVQQLPSVPSSPVQVIDSDFDDDEEVVDLDTREESPPRRTLVANRTFERREADVTGSRLGLINTQPQEDDGEIVSLETISRPTSPPPRLTIPPRLAMQRTASTNTSTSNSRDTPIHNLQAKNEQVVDLDTREDTPPPRQQTHNRPVGRKELLNGTGRHAFDLADEQDDEILPIEMEPIPMPASPPPESNPNALPGIDRTYSMAQPMANIEPPSKASKPASMVAKVRAQARAHKGTDVPIKKNGKGRAMETEDGQELAKELSKLDGEIASLDKQLEPLTKLARTLRKQRESLLNQIRARASASTSGPNGIGGSSTMESARTTINVDSIVKYRPINHNATTDYLPESRSGAFKWTKEIRGKARSVWGIRQFRLCQEGVINANMDGRDILCIMPTGGGKSLCYQLPALLTPGTTVVISPLISLMRDQITHLQEAGIESVMLTGGLSKGKEKEIYARLIAKCTKVSNSNYPTVPSNGPEIKLCYVTPEKIAQNREFGHILDTLNINGKLARFVIDEAHCASTLGHDHRPDYKKLSVLKSVFPTIPILAVTATLSRKVLPDLLKILMMPALTDGRAANQTGTVFFTSPLYRPNLHYSVVPKPANAKAAIDAMAEWIMEKHPGEAGIVYCHSKKDAEDVADKVQEASKGKIRTGWYHADVPDAQRERIHDRWRSGDIHLVAATIAFGLGIDKQDTRYVIHHTLPKSIDGLYQESGRAGRDGEDADCVLYYRGQDVTRLLSLTVGEPGARDRVNEILRYAQDLKTCRKLLFAKYFSTTASLPGSGFDANQSGQPEPCDHCDNCIRPKDSVENLDVTYEAWKILKLANAVKDTEGKLTLTQLADVVRGLKTDGFVLVDGEERSGYVGIDKKIRLNLDEICNGPAYLNKDQAETLIMQLLLDSYLDVNFNLGAYKTNVYAKPGVNALRITRLPLETVESGSSPLNIEISYILPKGKKRATKAATKSTQGKKTSEKRKVSNVATDDPPLSKKARMFSPDQDILMHDVSGPDDQARNGGIPAFDDSGDERGYDGNDDLAFYEGLEQAILEQRDEDGDIVDTMANQGNQTASEDDYDGSSDAASGWRCKI